MNLLIRHWEEIFQQKARTSSWNRRHTLELLLFTFINRANWIGHVHCWSRFRRDSSSLWAAVPLFNSYWKAKPTRWTLLRGISHLWQRQPAFCSTIFTCSPAKQQLCRYQNTKDISFGAETPDVHLFFLFVACVRFPCSYSVLQVLQPSAKHLTVLPVSASQEIPRHLD